MGETPGVGQLAWRGLGRTSARLGRGELGGTAGRGRGMREAEGGTHCE